MASAWICFQCIPRRRRLFVLAKKEKRKKNGIHTAALRASPSRCTFSSAVLNVTSPVKKSSEGKKQTRRRKTKKDEERERRRRKIKPAQHDERASEDSLGVPGHTTRAAFPAALLAVSPPDQDPPAPVYRTRRRRRCSGAAGRSRTVCAIRQGPETVCYAAGTI
ncbi:uncharacterized protein ARB_01371 [Trichophyton benhamiae CBS 112371]|uniref:Uncharacterized protein n=1 Tax=Arthroderma benhamiae (strain ATCC MYA-4681 / CBS 112371) TaxID=663331 RepID=D4AYV2_ARTBC|nr:uncharacterized protein ARB_01371 [Trichophyton benhamiae CBS 112371]EFE31772.1 hypothetical protein ARB_01371 [Trichophyton benhamiae CBS 112371]